MASTSWQCPRRPCRSRGTDDALTGLTFGFRIKADVPARRCATVRTSHSGHPAARSLWRLQARFAQKQARLSKRRRRAGFLNWRNRCCCAGDLSAILRKTPGIWPYSHRRLAKAQRLIRHHDPRHRCRAFMRRPTAAIERTLRRLPTTRGTDSIEIAHPCPLQSWCWHWRCGCEEHDPSPRTFKRRARCRTASVIRTRILTSISVKS